MENSTTLEQTYGKQLPKVADLLSAPLVAAASANSFMVREQTRFLMDTCFVSKGDNRYEPVIIEMTLTKSVISEGDNNEVTKQEITSTFGIPLLTLVPLNSLAVDNVDIDFSLEIVSYEASQSSGNESREEQAGNPNQTTTKEPVLTGKLSYDSSDKKENRSHNASKLNVKIHAGTIPLPVGLTTLIDLYVKSINATPNN
ncbi:MAG: DUF2589 domain-containing protein [Bacteroidales bacterium]|nr:DUF2589 domain-containing protein [Bacteroidales bacterium]MBN2749718.1 DUF2589 domain-containing protein [Bacteroidales bacterium]